MVDRWLVELLLAAEEQAPQVPPGQGQGGPGGGDLLKGLNSLLVPLAAVFFIFWLLVFRPEAKKRKARERMISGVKKGDTIVTTGGMFGKVWRVDAGEITVIVDRDVKVRFLKSSVLEVIRDEASGRPVEASEGDKGRS